MAQLIKLYDYVSRYEWNMFRYPSQYIRLKKENWESLYEDWLLGNLGPTLNESNSVINNKPSNLKKIKNFFTKTVIEEEKEDTPFPTMTSELELRKYFLDNLYPFQIKWATSTVSEMSVLDEGVETDKTLKYFLQRFPDIYLLMYYPVFNIRNAPVDGELILISPTNIEIIHLMELEVDKTIMATDERLWTIEVGDEIEHQISPIISLKRTEAIIKGILNKKGISFPIERSVVSRTNQILFHTEPFNINIIGKTQYEDWFHRKRNISSPLKKEQLEVAEALIQYCVSTSVRRPEWDRDRDIFPVGD